MCPPQAGWALINGQFQQARAEYSQEMRTLPCDAAATCRLSKVATTPTIYPAGVVTAWWRPWIVARFGPVRINLYDCQVSELLKIYIGVAEFFHPLIQFQIDETSYNKTSAYIRMVVGRFVVPMEARNADFTVSAAAVGAPQAYVLNPPQWPEEPVPRNYGGSGISEGIYRYGKMPVYTRARFPIPGILLLGDP